VDSLKIHINKMGEKPKVGDFISVNTPFHKFDYIFKQIK